MKHLVAQEHHPHLKKRALLELCGFIILVALSIQQKDVLSEAFKAIRNSQLHYLLLGCLMYWVMLPLTSFSYRLLGNRKVPIGTTMLAQLAASGPGRIIPGGLGHISVGAVHLHKVGFSTQRALVITVANNMLGLCTNLAIVAIAIVIHPNLMNTIVTNMSPPVIAVIFFGVLFLASTLLWASHLRHTKKLVKKLTKQWSMLTAQLSKKPKNLLLLMVIASAIVVGHALLLVFCGRALTTGVSMTDAVIALSVGVFVGGAVPTPGGLGGVEAGTISALILLGYGASEATSVALLFRVATYWQPLLPGVFSYIYLRRRSLL